MQRVLILMKMYLSSGHAQSLENYAIIIMFIICCFENRIEKMSFHDYFTPVSWNFITLPTIVCVCVLCVKAAHIFFVGLCLPKCTLVGGVRQCLYVFLRKVTYIFKENVIDVFVMWNLNYSASLKKTTIIQYPFCSKLVNIFY